MNKFYHILTNENLDIVIKNLGIPSVNDKQQLDLFETVATVVLRYEKLFNKLTPKEKTESMKFAGYIFDTLTDAGINSLCRHYILMAIRCFNNNVFDVEKGDLKGQEEFT
jgi:hypothetical protein